MEKAIEQLKALAAKSAYEAGFIFGSVARGEQTDDSDLDVQIITSGDNPSLDILHPNIDGVKLDLTFLSFDQVLSRTRQEIQAAIPRRIPMIGEALILFDNIGRLTKLHEQYREATPPKFSEQEHAQQRFLLFHANDKVERNLAGNPSASLLAMHISINDVLKIHYGLHGHWWVSNKRLLKDLSSWDERLPELLTAFLSSTDTNQKFEQWKSILDHVARPLGGYREIDDRGTISEISRTGLEHLGCR